MNDEPKLVSPMCLQKAQSITGGFEAIINSLPLRDWKVEKQCRQTPTNIWQS
jgi:hypothetical protein